MVSPDGKTNEKKKDLSSNEIVGGGDGVDITRQVKVELFHGNHLSIATTSGTTCTMNDLIATSSVVLSSF